jgi:hypothetical protein
MDYTIYGLAIVAILTLAVMAVKKFWPGYRDDNVVEEICEDIIGTTTGVHADLTPNSPVKPDAPSTPTVDAPSK